MAHYAFLDDKNIVTEVIVGIDETENIEGKSPEEWYGQNRGQKCLRTSFNKKIRGNYAGIGYFYMTDLDIFMPPKCHPEATLDSTIYQWACTNPDHSKLTL